MGQQRCLPERVWARCVCALDGSTSGMDAATAGGAARGGGSGGSSGSPVATSDGGSGGASGTAGPLDASHGDGGDARAGATGGSGADSGLGAAGSGSGGISGAGDGSGSGGSGSGGTGSGSGGTGSGSGGTGASGEAPIGYASCKNANACSVSGSSCNKVDATLLNGAGSVCAPPCQADSDCPMPPGSYDAMLTCASDHHCVLDCTLTLPLVSTACPAGLTCIPSPDGVTSLCYAP